MKSKSMKKRLAIQKKPLREKLWDILVYIAINEIGGDGLYKIIDEDILPVIEEDYEHGSH